MGAFLCVAVWRLCGGCVWLCVAVWLCGGCVVAVCGCVVAVRGCAWLCVAVRVCVQRLSLCVRVERMCEPCMSSSRSLTGCDDGLPVWRACAETGLPAVVFQHEMDHLDGLLHIDREMKAFVDSRDAVVERAHTQYLKDLLKYYNISASSAMAPDDC